MSNKDNRLDQHRSGSHITIIILALFILIVGSVTYFSKGHYLNKSQKVIEAKMNLIRGFVQRPSFSEGISVRAEANKAISINEIMQLDDQWIKHPDESQILSKLIQNDLSLQLIQFRREHPEFKEIFITDLRGLNVGLTNPTSDYYQADEAWWQKANQKGDYIGSIEYDESAKISFYGVYLQVLNENGHAIGILKGVLDAYDIRRISDL